MIWKDEQELIDSMLYWQKRALAAEKEREEILDDLEDYIIIAEYYKQQFLDKDLEIREVIDKFRIELGRRIVAIKYLKGEL